MKRLINGLKSLTENIQKELKIKRITDVKDLSQRVRIAGIAESEREEIEMIIIKKSKTADTRSWDFSSVTKEQLLESTCQHIGDVSRGLDFFRNLLKKAADVHDMDKKSGIDHFHSDFITGFKQTGWWDNHRKITRHHLTAEDGIPKDVNLIDVIEMIVDCVMAGMGRTGTVYPLTINPDVLKRAVDNTVELLKSQIIVEA